MLRILFLEDLASDFELAKTELQRSGFHFECKRVENKEAFLMEVERFHPDIIISDYMMPAFTGMEALKLALEFKPRIPFIILTGSMNEATAVECLKGGADDYVIKEHIARLPYSVKEILEQKELNALKIEAEENLLQSEENFHRSLDESHLGIRVVSVEGETVYANKALLDLYEFTTLEEFTSTPAKDRYTSESFSEHVERKAIRKQGLNGFGIAQYELSINRKNGEVRHIKVFRNHVLWNRTKHYQVISQDITEQKNAEEALRKLSLAVEQSPDAIIITDTDGIIEYVNPKTVELTGYSVDELLGKNPRIFSSAEKPKEAFTQLWNTIKAGNTWIGEFHNRKKNGEFYWESASISPILDKNNRITHFLAIKEDITSEKQMLEDLIVAKEKAEESDRLKSAFLTNISHEIRTPMNGILGFSGLLKMPGLSGDQQQEYISIIEKSGARMLNIINDLVDISTIEAGLMKISVAETKINEQTQFIYTFFKPEAEKKGLRITFRNGLPSEAAVINTDREKIYSILANLLKNAIKYTFNGTIEFGYVLKTSGRMLSGAEASGAEASGTEARENGFGQNAELEFYIKDTGIGIPKDRQKAIFDRFVQADIADKNAYQGAGLGLSITKAYVEMLGGKIWVESEDGQGSVFYFTIPYTPKSKEIIEVKKELSVAEGKTQVKKLKILITEDDETSAFFLVLALEAEGHIVLQSETGHEAIEACHNHPDIDLILMDIKMPDMDGYQATALIREFNKNVIIIAQTAYGMDGDREKALERGCNDYVSKPIQLPLLKSLLQKHFKN